MPLLLKRLLAPICCSLILMVSCSLGAVVTATFGAPDETPITSAGYIASGNTVELSLNFVPPVGTVLTVVKNTGLTFVQGTFQNLSQGQEVALTYRGITYPFVANYYGGTGNDLVLVWADNRAFAWGNNSTGQLGINNTSPILLPKALSGTGPLAGKHLVSISAGYYFSLALCADGTVAAWGSNNQGQLGNNSKVDSNVPVNITNMGILAGKRVVSISAGHNHSLALCSDGTVASWGSNGNGQLGNGGNISSLVPAAVAANGVLAGRAVVSISAGSYFSVALCSDGIPAAWGQGGQLGQTTVGNETNVPVGVARSGALAGKTVVRISSGYSHVLALCSDGSLVTWGSNNYGETGTATGGGPRIVSLVGALAGKTVATISAGHDYNLALCSDGTVGGWGSNRSKQLGNSAYSESAVPVPLDRSGVLAGRTIIAVAAGFTHSTALCSDGALVAWGGNGAGQMGNQSNTSYEDVPVLVAGSPFGQRKAVALASGQGADHTFALTALPSPSSDSTLSSLKSASADLEPAFNPATLGYFACVSNSARTLTLITTASNASSTITIDGLPVVSGAASQPITLGDGIQAIAITVTAPDGSSTSYAVTVLRPTSPPIHYTSADLVPLSVPAFDASGLTLDLSLGFPPPGGTDLVVIQNTGLRFIRGQFANLAQGATVSLDYQGRAYAFVADYFGGSGNDLVLRWKNSRVYAFGANDRGQLGDNSLLNRNLPRPVDDSRVLRGKTITAIALADDHTLVLCSDGTVAAWGDNGLGQLGDGKGDSGVISKVPVAVDVSGALAGKTVAAIAASNGSSLALCSDGTVVSWGNNESGQLGNGSNAAGSYSTVPVTVSRGVLAGRAVVAISAGGGFCTALCSDGKVAAWGNNYHGQLGNNSNNNSNVPVAVETAAALAGKTVTQISAGINFSLAKCADGTVVSWGPNDFGQLGNGSTYASNVPVIVKTSTILGGKTVTGISAGRSHGFAICADGTFTAWGSNDFGKFGNNSGTSSNVPIPVPPYGALVGRTVRRLVAASSHSFAICSDGTVATWGSNPRGELGNGDNISTTTPVAVSTSPIGTGGRFTLVPGSSTGNHVVLLVAIPPPSALTGLTNLTLGPASLSPAFSPGSFAYTSTVSNSIDRIVVTPTAINPEVSITVNGKTVVSGTASDPLALAEGDNVITIVATSPDGTELRNYRIIVTRGRTLDAGFPTSTSIPVIASSFNAGGSVINLSLRHAPATGTVLTVIKNTGPGPITGRFENLDQYQNVDLTFGNITYRFIANYHGGTGNDLELIWANNRAFSWGNNAIGQLGNNSTSHNGLPLPVNTGTTAGKTIVRLANGGGDGFALCSDSSLSGWGDNESLRLGISGISSTPVPTAINPAGALAGKTVVSIAAGESHTLALCSDGTVAAWGNRNDGRLGTGGEFSGSSEVPVAVATNGALAGKTVIAISAGGAHSLVLCSDGTVASWGIGNNGQLGTGKSEDANTPFAVVGTGALAGKTVVAIAAGGLHSLALCSDGTLVTWGYNEYGQLGNNGSINSSVPVAINAFGALAGRTVVAIGAGTLHSLALCSDGNLVSWGQNERGQLGNNSINNSRVPVLVNRSGALTGKTIQSISAGSFHSLARCSDGSLVAWGQNYFGELGINTFDAGSRVPVTVSKSGLPSGAVFLNTASGSSAYHSMAIVALPLQSATSLAATAIRSTSATLNGRIGALGSQVSVTFEFGLDSNYGTTVVSAPPTAAGVNTTNVAAMISGLSPGTVYHFRVVGSGPAGIARGGDQTFQTLSDNAALTGIHPSNGVLTPVFASSLKEYQVTLPFALEKIALTPATSHPGATVKVNGTPVAAGTASGQIPVGIGNTPITLVVTAEDGVTTRTYTVIVTRLPASFAFYAPGDVPVSANEFTAGGYPVEIVLNRAPVPGAVLTMVNNTGLGFISGTFGNLAQGQRVTLSFGGIAWDFVANYFGGTGNDLVLQWADIRMSAWGSNRYGQLGDHSTTGRPTPVGVDESGALAGKTVTAVAAGYLHSLALGTDGTLASWGYNVYGQLGNGGTAVGSSPVAVDRSGVLAGKTVVAISAGAFHNLALCSDGTIAAWGYNNHGQLGTGDRVTSHVPATVIPSGALAGKQVVGIAAAAYQSFARCADGTVVAWGYNDDGELGDGTTATRLIPVAVSTAGPLNGKKVAAISAGQYHALALCTDGTLVAWGYNPHGELGNGTTVSSSIPVAIGSSGILAGKVVAGVAAGSSHSLALCADGTVATWGSNLRNQLGTPDQTPRLLPLAVDLSAVADGRSVSRLGAGANHSVALLSDGSLLAWGDNADGQLGTGGALTAAVPSPVKMDTAGDGAPILFAGSGSAALHHLAVVAVSGPSMVTLAAHKSSLPNPAAATSDPQADPDHDGIPNLVEYAFGLDPLKDSSGQLPRWSRGGNSHVMQFNEPAGVTGVIYGAESSTTLLPDSWTPIPDTGTGAGHLFVIPAESGSRIFLRLKVSK